MSCPSGRSSSWMMRRCLSPTSSSKRTLANLRENPKIALAWWGEKGGFQIKADITIHTDGEIFRQDVEWVQGIKDTLKPKSAVVAKITDVYIVKSGPDAGKKIL
jgi:Predicted flavin-nucleotide-binding protein structurally related to pyridoxine 5''-phosphate oxidase